MEDEDEVLNEMGVDVRRLRKNKLCIYELADINRQKNENNLTSSF